MAGPHPPQKRPPASLLAASWALIVGASVCFALTVSAHRGFDARIYSSAIGSWLGGDGLYDWGNHGTRNLGFTYPPFAALVMVPLVLLPASIAWLGMATASAAAVWAACRAVAPSLATTLNRSVTGWTCVLVALVVTTPWRDTLGFGQVNIVLAALVVVGLADAHRGRARGGIWIGLAAAVKLTPAVFVLYLLGAKVTRRAGLLAAASAAGATVVAAAAAPGTSHRFWVTELWRTDRVGSVDSATNQALSGALARLGVAGLWPFLAAACLALGLWLGLRLRARGDWLEAGCVVGVTATLISPISWMHHLVWQPLLALLLTARFARDQRWGRRLLALGAYLAMVLALPDIARRDSGHHLDAGVVTVVGENAFVLVSLLLLALVASLLRAQSAAELPRQRNSLHEETPRAGSVVESAGS